MEIRLGTAGIPLSCKSNNSIDGIKEVARLGLHAMEVEFVRGVHMSLEKAKEVGQAAKSLNIILSIHAPYFINLASDDKEKIKASKKRIYDTLERAHEMGAKIIAVHAGYYGKNKEEAGKRIISNIERVFEVKEENKWFSSIGLETMGKQGQWGTLEEIINVSKMFKGVVPYVDFAHLFARNGGHIDYKKVFDSLESLELKFYNCHFSGVKYSVIAMNRGNERWHLPLAVAGPSFKEFAQELLKRKLNFTIICESPLIEKDSLHMKSILESLGHKF